MPTFSHFEIRTRSSLVVPCRTLRPKRLPSRTQSCSRALPPSTASRPSSTSQARAAVTAPPGRGARRRVPLGPHRKNERFGHRAAHIVRGAAVLPQHPQQAAVAASIAAQRQQPCAVRLPPRVVGRQAPLQGPPGRRARLNPRGPAPPPSVAMPPDVNRRCRPTRATTKRVKRAWPEGKHCDRCVFMVPRRGRDT